MILSGVLLLRLLNRNTCLSLPAARILLSGLKATLVTGQPQAVGLRLTGWSPLLSHRIMFWSQLAEASSVRLERIVSTGHATSPGEWYDQDTNEWVPVLRGRAGLRFEDEPALRVLDPGDYVVITAHRRHRVEWTDPGEPTVWLALHY